MKKLLTLVAMAAMSQFSFAQTSLSGGDIMFVGLNSDGNDEFAIILLKDVVSGTTITFTDHQWNTAGGFTDNTSFGACNSEAFAVWTATSSLPTGTIITFTNPGGTSGSPFAGTVSTGTFVSESGSCPDFSFSIAGETLFAYQGARPTTNAATNFLAAINYDGLWDGNGGSPSSTLSDKPANLSNSHIVFLTPSIDNSVYTGPLSGTPADLRTAIGNPANWSQDNTTPYTLPDDIGPAANVWNGSTSTDWSTASNWDFGTVPVATDNVQVPSGGNQPIVSSPPSTPAVCADLSLASGASLTIAAGKALTVDGSVSNDGTILIEADATGIGSLINTGTVSGSGSFQMEQYLTGSGGGTPDGLFYYVSSPITDATAAVYGVASGNKLWIDQEPTQNYAQLTFGSIALEVGQGYSARMGTTGTVTFDGSAYNTGNITEGSLTRTGTTEQNRGYNLVGNPYPSTVNWDDLGRTNLETTMWYRTHNGGTMLYDTYNATGQVGTNNNGSGTVDGTIPPTQAFWVRVDADGNTGQLDFENADRSHGTLAGIYKTEAQVGLVRMALSNGNISDEAIVMFDAAAQDGFDNYDSHKFWASNIPQLYMNIAEDTIAINGLYSTATNPTVALGIKVPTQGDYTLNTNDITVVGENVYLEDAYLNIFQDLNAEPNYAFTSDAGNIGDRFVLHFGMSVTGVEEAISRSYVFATNNQLNIILPQNIENGTVQVIDMAGRTVASEILNASTTILDMDVNAGIYLIRVETPKGTDTHKVVLK